MAFTLLTGRATLADSLTLQNGVNGYEDGEDTFVVTGGYAYSNDTSYAASPNLTLNSEQYTLN